MSERITYSPSLVRRAEAFARAAHGEQRYGDLPYAAHLQAVHDVLKEMGMNNTELLCGAWLHDALEDTSVTDKEVLGAFTIETYRLVAALTEEIPSVSAKPNHDEYFRQIAAHGPFAIVLKLADRIANVRACLGLMAGVDPSPVKLAKYKGQHEAFRAALYRDDCSGQTKAMWRELDGLLEFAGQSKELR